MSSRFHPPARDPRNTLFAAYPSSASTSNSKRASSASPALPSFSPRPPASTPSGSISPGGRPSSSGPPGSFAAYPGRSAPQGTVPSYYNSSGGSNAAPAQSYTAAAASSSGGNYAAGQAAGGVRDRRSGEEGERGDSGEGVFRAATPNARGQYSDAVLSELESQNEEGLGEMSRRVRMLKDITVSIGDEIRSSTALAEKMNDSFDNTRVRLRGTMNRMLRMAQRTGVGWKVWVGFIGAVVFLFWYVWLF